MLSNKIHHANVGGRMISVVSSLYVQKNHSKETTEFAINPDKGKDKR